VAASSVGGEAPRGQGATTENTGFFLREEQRRPAGMRRRPNAVASFTTGC
jgi:hypothetical protein